jgi:hypothetical protein
LGFPERLALGRVGRSSSANSFIAASIYLFGNKKPKCEINLIWLNVKIEKTIQGIEGK